MATLTTPAYGFPYPDGTERVADGDNAMGALGLAIETFLQARILAARMERTASQSIPASVTTDLACNVLIREDDPSGSGINPQIGNGSITLQRPGWWLVAAGVVWQSHASGQRELQLVCGSLGIVVADRMDALAAQGAQQNVATWVYTIASENLKATVNQTSPGALNALGQPSTYIAAARLPFP